MKTFVALFIFLCLVLFLGGAGIQAFDNFIDHRAVTGFLQGVLIMVIAVATLYGLLHFAQNTLGRGNSQRKERRTYDDL
jgi:divalent metal cation (Fe/Co/Zn/Cd) transporter